MSYSSYTSKFSLISSKLPGRSWLLRHSSRLSIDSSYFAPMVTSIAIVGRNSCDKQLPKVRWLEGVKGFYVHDASYVIWPYIMYIMYIYIYIYTLLHHKSITRGTKVVLPCSPCSRKIQVAWLELVVGSAAKKPYATCILRPAGCNLVVLPRAILIGWFDANWINLKAAALLTLKTCFTIHLYSSLCVANGWKISVAHVAWRLRK